MAGWTKIGNGTINKSKQEGAGAPYYGKCAITIDGREHQISIGAWVKDGQNGSKFFSLAFSVPEEAAQPAPAQTVVDDSILF